LKDENITEPENSLELIFAHVLKKKKLREVRGENLQKIQLSDEQVLDIDEKVLGRLSRMPVQFILQEWEFRDVTLKMKVPTFIPRPETEELVELISQQVDGDCNILEVGVGSGAISLALLNELPKIKQITAIDQSKAACDLAMENARNLKFVDRIKIFRHKLESGTLPQEIAPKGQTFDIIVSNPPYIPTKDLLKLEPEIYLYENVKALDGGNDGLDVIKHLLALAANYLKTGGHLWIEVDPRHPEIIKKIVENNQEQWKLNYVACYRDIFKKDRFVEISKL
jgi:release factor glutamine methyltransferase